MRYDCQISTMHFLGIGNFYTFNEFTSFIYIFVLQTLDIQAFTLLMDEIKPSREILSKRDLRELWLRKVCEYRPVVERIIEYFSNSNYDDRIIGQKRCKEAIKNARLDILLSMNFV